MTKRNAAAKKEAARKAAARKVQTEAKAKRAQIELHSFIFASNCSFPNKKNSAQLDSNYSFDALQSRVNTHELVASEYVHSFASNYASIEYLDTNKNCKTNLFNFADNENCEECKVSQQCKATKAVISRKKITSFATTAQNEKIERTVRSLDSWKFVTLALIKDNSKDAKKALCIQVQAKFGKSDSASKSFINSINCCVNALTSTAKYNNTEKSIVKKYSAHLTKRFAASKIVLTATQKASTCYVDKVHSIMKRAKLIK